MHKTITVLVLVEESELQRDLQANGCSSSEISNLVIRICYEVSGGSNDVYRLFCSGPGLLMKHYCENVYSASVTSDCIFSTLAAKDEPTPTFKLSIEIYEYNAGKMEELLQIAEEIIELLPDELLKKYMQLRGLLVKSDALQALNYQNDDISIGSLRDKLSLFEYLRVCQHGIGIQVASEQRNEATEVVDAQLESWENELLEKQKRTYRSIDSETENASFEVNVFMQTDIEGAEKGIEHEADLMTEFAETEGNNEIPALNAKICKVLRLNQTTECVDDQLAINVQKLCDELVAQKELVNKLSRSIAYLEEKSGVEKIENTEMEHVFKQLVKEADKLKGEEGINQQEEQEIRELEATIAELTVKLEESGIMQKQAQEAYFQSIQQLKRKSDSEIERLQMELARMHDRLRKMQKSVESVDTSVFDSLVSM